MVLVTCLLVGGAVQCLMLLEGENDAVKVLLFLCNKLPFRVGRLNVATSRIASLKEWR